MRRRIVIILICFLIAAILCIAGVVAFNLFQDQSMLTDIDDISQNALTKSNNSATADIDSDKDSIASESGQQETESLSGDMLEIANNDVSDFILNIMDYNARETAFQKLSHTIDGKYNTETNIVPTLVQQGMEMLYLNEKYNVPQINSIVPVSNDGNYLRYVAIATSERIDEPVVGYYISKHINVVYNCDTHLVEFLNMFTIEPAHSTVVEEGYAALENYAPLSQTEEIKKNIALIYSYSPFIENEYWTCVSGIFKNDNSSVYTSNTDDIVLLNQFDWLPTGNGMAKEIMFIEEPELLNVQNGKRYYSLETQYLLRDFDVFTGNTVVNSTLYVLADDNGHVLSLKEKVVSQQSVETTVSGLPLIQIVGGLD